MLSGAGLSAASGLPTFRGPGGLWRSYNAQYLATPGAFCSDPGLVWQFYNYRRHMSLNVRPNRAHLALAELAKKRPGFIHLTQNVDGLSPRAGHPAKQLMLLHGSLFDVKCFNNHCDYVRRDDFTDPVAPVLALPEDESQVEDSLREKTGAKLNRAFEVHTGEMAAIREADISDPKVPIPEINPDDLPHCPKCKTGLLRPGVVWFGEPLPDEVMHTVHQWIDAAPKIDLMLVIGTSSSVYPAAGYTEVARQKGARTAVINMDEEDVRGLAQGDWFFKGDASEIVPEILKSAIGEIAAVEDKI